MGSGKGGRITTCPANQTVRKESRLFFLRIEWNFVLKWDFRREEEQLWQKRCKNLFLIFLPELAESCLFYRKWDTKSKSFLEKAVSLADDQGITPAS